MDERAPLVDRGSDLPSPRAEPRRRNVRLPVELREAAERIGDLTAPGLTKLRVVPGVWLETDLPCQAERVSAEDGQIERRPDRQVALDGGVERDQRAACRILQRHLRPDDAVEDRLSVLALAELQVRRLRRAPDAVALR